MTKDKCASSAKKTTLQNMQGLLQGRDPHVHPKDKQVLKVQKILGVFTLAASLVILSTVPVLLKYK